MPNEDSLRSRSAAGCKAVRNRALAIIDDSELRGATVGDVASSAVAIIGADPLGEPTSVFASSLLVPTALASSSRSCSGASPSTLCSV